ncbi:Eco57I restriction-modification methylase domain-containing protein [Nocardia sp. alder85J]|uniref:Eco57I restriction-modification methylase domain-containing protein n=1 Tax=Nocardia sp. alder85J TaxID=2862949 RepID=UPI002B1CC5EC|nr:DNA methyltransferase [Nocardia sp. alder85J]
MVTRSPRRPGSTEYDHRDWLALIDYSGPFLSVPVLKRHFSAGLDPLAKPERERLRRAHATMPGPEWIDYVLRDLLEWGDALISGGLSDLAVAYPEHDTVLTPDFALRDPSSGEFRLLGLISDGSPTQRIKDSEWSATPADRLMKLLRHHKIELGLCTDGRWWALLWCPVAGGATTIAVFDSVNWQEAAEREVVKAFLSILRRSRFFAVPEGETLPALLAASIDSQEELTEQLGVNVRRAVELLVMAVGRANTRQRETGHPGFLSGDGGAGRVTAEEVYQGAVAVMMRIVFLLFAEERGLLPSDKELYRKSYSVGPLLSALQDRVLAASETELEHTYGAWNRLLATFNAVYHGIDHPELTMHAHDGSIFDPQRFPWLPATIDDRTVLHMLRAVQEITIGRGKNAELRRLSFNQLDVEQIGYVYEGLLAFEGRYANETVLGLIGKPGLEAEVPLRSLIEARRGTDAEFAAKLAADYQVGTVTAIMKKLQPLPPQEREIARGRLLAVTGNDHALVEQLLPFAGLLRTDLREQPYVILADALYVTESALRGSTGTHYTPKFLAEQVVEGALEPLVFDPGPLQTAATTLWKPVDSATILSLKVADIAVGSAAFLVAACRYLARHLVEAWSREGDSRAADYVTRPKENALADDADPVVIDARRQIIEHCLYGADINPMAVEMAKLSLWLVSMDPARPFTFLDDRLVCGDSLLGITSVDQIEWMHLDPAAGRRLYADDKALFDLTAGMRGLVDDLARDRKALTELDGSTLNALAEKRRILEQTTEKAARLDLAADLVVAAALGMRDGSLDRASGHAVQAVTAFLGDGAGLDGSIASDEDLARRETAHKRAQEWLRTDLPVGAFTRDPLHWPLVFPEVFDHGRAGGGFDAIIGNPPFLGGKKISGAAGAAYREFLVRTIAEGTKGNADLIAYFLLRTHDMLHDNGQVGLIATNTLAQGDTREVGLDRLCDSGVTIRQSVKSAPWPSRSAVLEYCAVWTSKQIVSDQADRLADGIRVTGITSSLDPKSRMTGQPHRLHASSGISYIGSYLLGLGFIMEPSRAQELISEDPRNADVLFPYLNGQDLNNRPDFSGSRWVINFHDWTEDRARTYGDVFSIVEHNVKPERQRIKPDGSYVLRRPLPARYWIYADKRPLLYREIAGMERVIAITLVSKTVMPAMVPTTQVFAHKLGVFATNDTAMLALLSSAQHYWWTASRSSTMKADINYSPSDVFETLPLPELTNELRTSGDRLDQRRREVMLTRDSGLTKTYNLVHAPACQDPDIIELREIHRDIDMATCLAYGWDDLTDNLGHDHHDLGRETRYTVAPGIQREFIDRLLELNHARYAAEVEAGLHDKKQNNKKANFPRKKISAEQGDLF